MPQTIRQWLPLLLLLLIFILFFSSNLYTLLSFETLKHHQQWFMQITQTHFWIVSFLFILLYILVIACSIPVATVMTLASGFLFGALLGSLFAIIGASVGAVIAFSAYQSALQAWVIKKMSTRLQAFVAGFQRNAFCYCLFLRLVPLFPFWSVNMAMALLGMKRRDYFFSTIIGIIPATALYAYLGSGFSKLIDHNIEATPAAILQPSLIVPMVGLALLSLIPILYRYYKAKKDHD